MSLESDQMAEYRRLSALAALEVLDTPPEERFDRLTRLAASALSVPIALVVLVDRERQWFKSRLGLAITQTARSLAFCNHAIAARAMLIVADARADARFADNPLVTGAPHIRFYASQPVFTHEDQAVGTLCVIDTKARHFDAAQQQVLRDLASLVQDELNKATLITARNTAEIALNALNEELEKRIDDRTRSLRELNESMRREMRQRLNAEATLRASEERIRTIIESSFTAFVCVDAHGCVVDWNGSAERTFGWTRAQALGVDLATLIIPPHLHGQHGTGLLRRLVNGDPTALNERLEMPALTRSGADITVELTINAFEAGGQQFFGAFLHDISAQKRIQLKEKESEERLRTIADNLPVLISYIDTDKRYQFANAQYKSWLNKDPADMIGKTAREIFSAEFCDVRAPFLERCLQGQASEIELTVGEGAAARMVHTAFLPHWRDNKVQGAYLLSTDVTATRLQEARLQDLANTDALTGLPNRRSYEAALTAASERARMQQQGLALMFLDIDHFKLVNDAWGHAAGDEVLQEFARRLLAVVRKSDTVCRLAGDEFTVVLEGVPTPEVCHRLGAAILEAMQVPFTVGGQPRPVSTSIGIAWSAHDTAPQVLSEHADSALYKAKEGGRMQYFLRMVDNTGERVH